jgi:hypothetical protein
MIKDYVIHVLCGEPKKKFGSPHKCRLIRSLPTLGGGAIEDFSAIPQTN